MAFENYNRSVVDLVGDVVRQGAQLVRKEGELARTEIAEKIGAASHGIALLVGGAVLLIPALVILLGAGVSGLVDAGWSAWAAALAVGGVTCAIGVALVMVGANQLNARELTPKRTIRQFKNVTNLNTNPGDDRDVQHAA